MGITKRVTYVNEEGFEFRFEPISDTLKITETKDGYEARYLISDNDPCDPRNDDNIGVMVCFHKRYTLGDHDQKRNGKYLVTETSDQFQGWQELEAYLRKENHAVVVLPLYLYDHSGISIRTYKHGYHANWDCGQVGFIYITKEKMKKEGMTKKQIEKYLIGEVETYDQYLQGDVYCIVCEKYNKDKEPIDYDTCGGYYGYEYAEKALATDI